MGTGDTLGAEAALRRVPPQEARTVRHFDQLTHREQRAFLQLYRGEDPDRVPLAHGEVIVFTAYFRVERSPPR